MLHFLSGRFSCDPLRCTCLCRNFPIQCHGIFHHYIRCLRRNIMEEYRVQTVTFFPHKILNYCNSRFTQYLCTFSCHLWIRIPGTNHHFFNLLFYDRFRTRRCLAIMTAWFQRNIDCRTLCRFCKRCDCIALCMKFSAFFMITFPDDPAVFYDHCTYHGIRIRPSFSFFCKLDCPEHVFLIRHFSSFFLSYTKTPAGYLQGK